MYICFVKLKTEASKKRPVEAPKKTPVPDKKAKFITPEKTGELLFFISN
jgi:hypothetical protein